MNAAIQLIQTFDNKFSIQQASSIYETATWGKLHQPKYLNQVVVIDTFLSPFQLLNRLKKIEKQLGRKHKNLLANRVIDIDILLYNDIVFQTKQLQIPHPRMHLRQFTLIPLNEIAADYEHPILKVKIKDILINCEDTLKVSIFEQ
ncbi:MAG: 2-amino-4-hydroxy-6-hydroxymethyldihydropteridine diphosphokinase [Chitinophagales bacterium]